MIFSTFDVVVLTKDIPEEELISGMVGVVIDVYAEPCIAYEVEFSDTAGRTFGQLALMPENLRLATDAEILRRAAQG